MEQNCYQNFLLRLYPHYNACKNGNLSPGVEVQNDRDKFNILKDKVCTWSISPGKKLFLNPLTVSDDTVIQLYDCVLKALVVRFQKRRAEFSESVPRDQICQKIVKNK